MKNRTLKKACLLVLAAFIYLSGCQTTTSNLSMDLNNYNVSLYVTEYNPQIGTAGYPQLGGKKICLSSIRNEARDTTMFYYYSQDMRVQYSLAGRPHAPMQLVQNFLWYSYQKAFAQAGIEASVDCSAENIPELWVIIQSLNDDELRMKITVMKNRNPVYEKDLMVTMSPSANHDVTVLKKRAYDMIDLTVTKILDDPGFQKSILQ
jgi:hypothetical protein